MQLDDVRSLKALMLNPMMTAVASAVSIRSLGVRTQRLGNEVDALRSMAIGITKSKQQHRLAVRVQRRSLLDHPMIERMRKRSKGEIDVQYVGKISKRETPGTLQKRRRPMVIGCSIGHFKITAGTLGCFVKTRSDQKIVILSNNHVLANENSAKKGDVILQPGNFDGGTNPAAAAATLLRFIKLKVTTSNLVDCAIAIPTPGLSFNRKKMGKKTRTKAPASAKWAAQRVRQKAESRLLNWTMLWLNTILETFDSTIRWKLKVRARRPSATAAIVAL